MMFTSAVRFFCKRLNMCCFYFILFFIFKVFQLSGLKLTLSQWSLQIWSMPGSMSCFVWGEKKQTKKKNRGKKSFGMCLNSVVKYSFGLKAYCAFKIVLKW